MWSHYSDSHKGVCLTFNMEKDPNFFEFPFKVNYPVKYPLIDPFENSTSDLQALFATKSGEWHYEKEVRIIKENNVHQKYRGAIAFNPETLTEIKFGYKTSDEQVKTIKNLVIHKYPHIKLYKSKIKDDHFGIEYYPLG